MNDIFALTDLAEAQVEAGLVMDANVTLREALLVAKSKKYVPAYSLGRILETLVKMHDASLL